MQSIEQSRGNVVLTIATRTETEKSPNVSVSMRARRLDDRIRELCAKAVAAKDPEEVKSDPLGITGNHSSVHAAAQNTFGGKS